MGEKPQRAPLARAQRDAELLVEIRRVHHDREIGRGLYGARKVWKRLRREGQQVARCAVERLMRADGMRGTLQRALELETRGVVIGWIPSHLVEEVHQYLESGRTLSFVVDRVSCPEAPWHVRVLCRLTVSPAPEQV